MPITGIVALTNTFDDWRSKTNETIIAYNQLEAANIQFYSNTSNTLQINGANVSNIRLSNAVYLSVNALPSTGGNLTGQLNISSLSIRSNGMILMGDMRILTNGHIILI